MSVIIRFCSILYIALSIVTPLSAADKSPFDINDDSALRRSLYSEWFNESPQRILNNSLFFTELESGERVKVSIENSATSDEFSIILARELSGSFSGWAQGSWIITRHKKTGALLKARVFLRSDPYTYIQFRPSGDKDSLLDVVIYDANIIQSLKIPFSFSRILMSPLNEVLTNVEKRVPLKYFQNSADNYTDVRSLITQIRANLKGLEFADDGAINEKGDYVFIETLAKQTDNAGLNCSGFAKWVVDGMLHPITGKKLAIEPLKQPFGNRGSPITDPYEDIRDPYFGLDWIRNLAAAAATSFRSSAFANLDEFEVRNCPFSTTVVRTGKTTSSKPYTGYLENAGYSFEGLQALLYTLAIDEPGHIYLGAVNNESNVKPRMRQFFHIAVLIPYFDNYGIFHIALFESAAETNFNKFKNRYPAGTYINLVRLNVETTFDPN